MAIASLFNLSGKDLVIILLIVFRLFGAKKLAELTEGIGRAVREFTKGRDEFEREVTRPIEPTVRPAASARPWRYILSRLHDGYAGAAAAPCPLAR